MVEGWVVPGSRSCPKGVPGSIFRDLPRLQPGAPRSLERRVHEFISRDNDTLIRNAINSGLGRMRAAAAGRRAWVSPPEPPELSDPDLADDDCGDDRTDHAHRDRPDDHSDHELQDRERSSPLVGLGLTIAMPRSYSAFSSERNRRLLRELSGILSSARHRFRGEPAVEGECPRLGALHFLRRGRPRDLHHRASHGSQVDIDVYLTGGKHAFSSDLYSARFEGLYFTYPPFAALVFALPAFVFGFTTVQVLWGIVNIAALATLVYLTLRTVRPISSRRRSGAGRSCSPCRPSLSTRSSRTSGSVRSTSCSVSDPGIFSVGAGSVRSRFHSVSPPVSPPPSS